MDKKIRIACIIGTRPEIIKMAPVIVELKKNDNYKVTIINTAQHRHLIDEMLTIFNIYPEIDFNVMHYNQTLSSLTSVLFEKFDALFTQEYDLVLVQGDTTSALVATQVAFYHRIPVGHVEAGLRTNNFYHPFPEEMNRVFISKLATLHFVPTSYEADTLIIEKIPKKNIHITGNTVIDSLMRFSVITTKVPILLDENKRMILVTLHRRESFGNPIKAVFNALIQLANSFANIEIVYPVHPNPNVQDIAKKMLENHQNIHLINAVPYDVFVSLLSKAYVVMSDSGGIQEEAPALGKPVLILRNVTERPLVVSMGMAKLVGTNTENIVQEASRLLTDTTYYQNMQKHMSPYGDGFASMRIVNIIGQYFSLSKGMMHER